MSTRIDRWKQLYNQPPLCKVPRHYAGISRSPFLLEYLATVLRNRPHGGSTLETAIGSGYGAIWLSRRAVCAAGLNYAPSIVERARQLYNVLDGQALFRTGDLFHLWAGGQPHYGRSEGTGRL